MIGRIETVSSCMKECVQDYLVLESKMDEIGINKNLIGRPQLRIVLEEQS